MKKIIVLILVILSFMLSTKQSNAVTTPTFPSCTNPQGELIVSYPSGTHGIVGDSTTHTGSDKVYKLSDQALAQCFCPTNGSGIQTNWVKSSLYSGEEIKVLLSQGWIYIPDGSAWGLSAESYLAYNTSFTCNTNNGGSAGSDGKSDGKSDGRSDGKSSNPVTVTSALTLAGTGNMLLVVTLFVMGAASLFAGYKLSFSMPLKTKKSKKTSK